MVFATRYRKFIIAVFLTITAFFAFHLAKIEFGQDLNDFIDKDEKVFVFNEEFFSHFEEEIPNSVMIGIQNDKPLDFDLIQELDSFSKSLESISGIQRIFSITNQKLAVFSSFGTIPYQVLNIDSEEEFNQSFLELDSIPDIKNRFVSKDNLSTLIYAIIQDSASLDELIEMKRQTDSIALNFNFGKLFFVNTKHNDHLITLKIKDDSGQLILIAFTLIILILLYFFRSIVGVVIPFAIVVCSVIWIMGTISLFGFTMNVLTIAIPVIVGVISLSDVIHIISRYSEEKSSDKIEKIRNTRNDILKAIILTTLTTSFGFLSLSNSNIQVFDEFSIFTAFGVFYAFFIAYFLLPALLFYSKKITLHNSLGKLTPKKLWIKPTIIIAAIVVVFSILGILKVKHNNFVYKNMGEKDDITQVMNFMEKEMFGIRDLTVTISLNDSSKSLYDQEILAQLDKIESFVETEYEATISVGLATTAKQVNRALNGGYASEYRIPTEKYDAKQVKKKLKKHRDLLKLKSFVSEKNNSTFIQTKAKDYGSFSTRKSNKRLLEFAKMNTPKLTINFGGTAYIIDETNVNVSNGMIWNLVIIIIFIFFIVSFIFKSISVGFFSLFPNILPLIAITAVVGWFDFGMNIGTTIVYTIAFGIAVDDTIHFLGRYKIELDKGNSNYDSLITTITTSGGAIFLTTLVLVAGFGVLILSSFYANFITGLLVTISLIVALICDLYLLPVLLSWWRKK
ncbi:MAG: MMPL family transporter [Flavobacteriales bacterium]